MIAVEKKRINHIPVLHVAKQTEISAKLPLIIFLHGFTSTKEKNLHYAYLFAEKGFRVLMPDAKYHGERGEGLSEKELSFRFWEIVISSIDELEMIRDEFEADGLIERNRIGVAGTSMGGITMLGSLAKYEWIKAGVSLMGNPSFEQFAKWQLSQLENRSLKPILPEEEIEILLEKLRAYDLSLQPEKLNQRPLLFWHGKMDPVVPYQSAYHFYQQIRKNYYLGFEHRLDFITDEQAGHTVSNKGVISAANWFDMHL